MLQLSNEVKTARKEDREKLVEELKRSRELQGASRSTFPSRRALGFNRYSIGLDDTVSQAADVKHMYNYNYNISFT